MSVLDQARETMQDPPTKDLYKNFGLVKAWLAEQIWPGDDARPNYMPRSGASSKKTWVVFQSDMSEFSPNTKYPKFQREIAIMSSVDGMPQDWDTIIEPSLIKLFGKDYANKIFNDDGSAKPFYAQWENAPRSDGMTSNTTGNVFTVPSFLAIYSDNASTQAALDQIKGGNATSSTVDLSQAVQTARQLMTALSTTDRGKVFAQMNDTGELETFTPGQINDIFTQAGL